jgi:hypothetical protein
MKPDDGQKIGHNGDDARKAASDALLCLTGVCKHSGKIEIAENRLLCSCVGCQSWSNNERQAAKDRANRAGAERYQAEIDAAEAKQAAEGKAAEAEAAERRDKDAIYRAKGTTTGAYAPPSLSLPVSEPQSQQRGPWGPAPRERREERSVEQQSPAAAKPDPAPPVDLLGDDEPVLEQAPPVALLDADTADLLGVTQESRDLTSLLVSHAAVDDEDETETDLIGLAPTPETKPSEQLDGLF